VDFRDDLKLPDETIQQITKDTKDAKPTSSACVRLSCYKTPSARCIAYWKRQMPKRYESTMRRLESPVVMFTRSRGSHRAQNSDGGMGPSSL
jgi:hypothetical protein